LKIFAVFILCFAFLNGCANDPKISITADQSVLNKLTRISVINFKDAPGAETGSSGSIVANAVTLELMKVPSVILVERKKLHSILEEIKLGMSGLTDEKQAIKVGKLLGANAVILGTTSQFGTSTIPIFLGLFTVYKDVYNVAADIRIVDVETGMVVFSGSNSASSTQSYEDAASKVAQGIVAKYGEAVSRTCIQ